MASRRTLVQLRTRCGARAFTTKSCLREDAAGPSAASASANEPAAAEDEASTRAAAERGESMSKNAASHSHRKAFVRWVSGQGQRYSGAAREPGMTNYLDGKAHPFPLNPMFRPQPPVSSAIKDGIVQEWQNGTGLRQISSKFGVTLERVEAVLALRQVRDQWTEQGRPLMASYAKAMSIMLGGERADAEGRATAYERTGEVRIEPTPQRFRLVPEGMDMTAEEAAVELGKTPFATQREAQIQKFLRKSAFERRTGSQTESNQQATPVVADAIKTEPARWSYRIRDDSRIAARAPKARPATSPKNFQLRRPDGTLLHQKATIRKSTDLKWARQS